MARIGIRLAAIAYVAGLARLVLLADRDALPAWARRVHEQPLGDDLAHLLLALGLTLVLDLALAGRRAFGLRVGTLLALVALTAEEASQAFFPTRVLSVSDLLATWIGVAIGAWFLAPGGWTVDVGTPDRSSDVQDPQRSDEGSCGTSAPGAVVMRRTP